MHNTVFLGMKTPYCPLLSLSEQPHPVLLSWQAGLGRLVLELHLLSRSSISRKSMILLLQPAGTHRTVLGVERNDVMMLS